MRGASKSSRRSRALSLAVLLQFFFSAPLAAADRESDAKGEYDNFKALDAQIANLASTLERIKAISSLRALARNNAAQEISAATAEYRENSRADYATRVSTLPDPHNQAEALEEMINRELQDRAIVIGAVRELNSFILRSETTVPIALDCIKSPNPQCLALTQSILYSLNFIISDRSSYENASAIRSLGNLHRNYILTFIDHAFLRGEIEAKFLERSIAAMDVIER